MLKQQKKDGGRRINFKNNSLKRLPTPQPLRELSTKNPYREIFGKGIQTTCRGNEGGYPGPVRLKGKERRAMGKGRRKTNCRTQAVVPKGDLQDHPLSHPPHQGPEKSRNRVQNAKASAKRMREQDLGLPTLSEKSSSGVYWERTHGRTKEPWGRQGGLSVVTNLGKKGGESLIKRPRRSWHPLLIFPTGVVTQSSLEMPILEKSTRRRDLRGSSSER